MNYLQNFLWAWLFTITTETAVLFLVLKYFYKDKNIAPKIVIIAGIFANSLTLPYVWFIFPFLFFGHYIFRVIFNEIIIAWLIEAIFYKYFLKLPLKSTLFLSFLANLISFVLGRIIFKF